MVREVDCIQVCIWFSSVYTMKYNGDTKEGYILLITWGYITLHKRFGLTKNTQRNMKKSIQFLWNMFFRTCKSSLRLFSQLEVKEVLSGLQRWSKQQSFWTASKMSTKQKRRGEENSFFFLKLFVENKQRWLWFITIYIMNGYSWFLVVACNCYITFSILYIYYIHNTLPFWWSENCW